MTAAQPTYSSKNAIDYLYEAQDELYSSQDKKNGKESDIPLNDVLRFLTFRPFVILKQVSVHIKCKYNKIVSEWDAYHTLEPNYIWLVIASRIIILSRNRKYSGLLHWNPALFKNMFNYKT